MQDKLIRIWKKVELPIVALLILIGTFILIGSMITYKPTTLADEAKILKMVNIVQPDLWTMLGAVVRSLVFYGTYLLQGNFLSAVIIFLVVIKLVFLKSQIKSMGSAKAQTFVNKENKKIEKYYANKPQDQATKLMKQRDVMNINKMKKNTSDQTKQSGWMMLSILPTFFVFGIVTILEHVFPTMYHARVLWFWMDQPDIVVAIVFSIVSIVSQYFTSKGMPTVGDGQMQKMMMYFMPLIFIWYLFQRPSIYTLMFIPTYLIQLILGFYFHGSWRSLKFEELNGEFLQIINVEKENLPEQVTINYNDKALVKFLEQHPEIDVETQVKALKTKKSNIEVNYKGLTSSVTKN